MTIAIPFCLLSAFEIYLFFDDSYYSIQHLETFESASQMPTNFGDERLQSTDRGYVKYKPFASSLININSLGFRTHEPTQKLPGERRIAIAGGSAAWGWFVSDSNTIPVLLERKIHEAGIKNVNVFNFGVEGIRFEHEIKIIEDAHAIYDFDLIVFYTGVNDAWHAYQDNLGGKAFQASRNNLVKWLRGFRVYRFLEAFIAKRNGVVPDNADTQLSKIKAQQYFNAEILPQIRLAERICDARNLPCVIVLQPLLQFKEKQTNVGAYLLNNHIAFFGDFRPFITAYYDAFSKTATSLPVHDYRGVFNDEERVVFGDSTHVNEVGNRIVANHLLGLVINEFRLVDN